MNKLKLTILFCAIYLSMNAQQDPMFTKYMFNPMNYNPAYTGTVGALDMTLLHRQQWWGIKGAPMTQNFTIHTPIREKNIGVGLNVSHDMIGNSRQFNVYGSFAYHLPVFGKDKNGEHKGHISFGLQGGVSNWSADWSQLSLENPTDPTFQNMQPNRWLPNFGLGVYLYTPKWFVGISSPMLVNNALRRDNDPSLPVAQQYRHYYFTAGGAIPLGTQDFVLRPTMLIKHVGLLNRNIQNRVGAPTEFDLDLSLVIHQMYTAGISFRSAFELALSSYDSIDFWFSVRLKNGLRIGAAYDFSLTKLQGPAQGSYELLLGYDLVKNISKVKHIRYF